MKKFFSLVLALVMALSLTTVAWGALTAGTLPAAVSGTITLTEDVTFSGQNAADQLSGYVIDLNDKTMTLSGNTYLTGETTIKNGNIVVSGAISDSYLCLYTASTKLTLEDVNLTGTFNAYAVLNGAAGSTLVIKNSVIDVQGNITNPDSMGNIIYGGNVTVDNSTIKGKNTVRGIGLSNVTIQNNSTVEISDVETGLNNSTVTVDDSTVTITNATKRAVRLNNNTLTLQGGATLKAENCAEDIVGIGTTDTVSVSSDSTLNAVDDVTVAKVGTTGYPSLTAAMKAVTSGATLTLLKDVTISDTWDCRTNGANFTVPVTIDGDGHKLTFTGKVDDKNWNTVFRFEDTATVKNLTIDASAATGIKRGISAKLSITVENCKLIGNGSGYGVIFGEGAGADIGNVTATITNSTFTNWAKGVSDNANAQDAKSVSITGSTFDNADVNVSAKETVTFTGNTVDDGSVIIHTYTTNSDLAVTATGNTLDTDEVNKIKAETITTDTNDFAITGTLTAPAGYQVLKTTNGTYVVVPAVTRGDKYDLYIANAGMKDALAAGAETIPALSFNEKPAKSNQDGSGNIAYIEASNGEYFVKTMNPTVADYAVTDSGKTTVKYYVSVVDLFDVEYWATAKAFTNFGTKCGQLFRMDTTKEYYEIEKAEAGLFQKGDVTYFVAPGTVGVTMTNVLVGNEIKTVAATPVDDTNTVLTPDEILAHKWAVTGVKAKTDGTTKVTEIKCLNCPVVITKVYDEKDDLPAGSIPQSVTYNGTAVWFALPVAGTSATVVGTTGGTINSADTFDAGIAMYVGMSVMAAAGSVVVLKKRED